MRIFQAIPLKVNATVELAEEASHRLVRVLRAKIGDVLHLFNGQGGEYAGRLVRIHKKSVQVKLFAFIEREIEPPLHINLAQGMARGEKMDFIIQKAVELGATQIIPLYTERCNVKLKGERLGKRAAHWQSIAISACEQSGRNKVPTIQPINTLSNWLPTASAERQFVLSPTGLKLRLKDQKTQSIDLLVGPEGGLSSAEIKLAEKQGFEALNLGPRILRTETTPLAAIAIFQALYGDLA